MRFSCLNQSDAKIRIPLYTIVLLSGAGQGSVRPSLEKKAFRFRLYPIDPIVRGARATDPLLKLLLHHVAPTGGVVASSNEKKGYGSST